MITALNTHSSAMLIVSAARESGLPGDFDSQQPSNASREHVKLIVICAPTGNRTPHAIRKFLLSASAQDLSNLSWNARTWSEVDGFLVKGVSFVPLLILVSLGPQNSSNVLWLLASMGERRERILQQS